MEPRDKALEIFNNFYEITRRDQAAVNYSLICVNQIIEAFNFPKYTGDPEQEVNGDEIFWLEVKAQIERWK